MEDKNIIRRCKALVEKECANCCDHWCPPEDRPCHVINNRYETIHDGAIDCDCFTEAVLRGEPELYKLVQHELHNGIFPATTGCRTCDRCGEPYVPTSPRQKYCVLCGQAVKKQQNREKQRRHKNKIQAQKDVGLHYNTGQHSQKEVKHKYEGS